MGVAVVLRVCEEGSTRGGEEFNAEINEGVPLETIYHGIENNL
jgi:hypothetical protein